MRVSIRTGRPRAALCALLVLLACAGCAPVTVGFAGGGGGDDLTITLTSNQENTVFFGRRIGGPQEAVLVGEQDPAARPEADGMVRLGQGKFVRVRADAQGVYEVVARPPGYRERTTTIAPPLTSRLGFTFEISDRVGHRATAWSEPPARRMQTCF